MSEPTGDQRQEADAIEKHVQRHIMDARDTLNHLMRAMSRWRDALDADDPVEAERWMGEASRRLKPAVSSTQTEEVSKEVTPWRTNGQSMT